MVESELFCGVGEEGWERLGRVLDLRERAYARGELLLRRGDTGVPAGLVVAGRVRMEATDGLGGTTVLGWAAAGEVFAEAYAVLGDEPLLVDVVCDEDCRVLWLEVERLAQEGGDPACRRVWANLCRLMAARNVGLSRRALVGAPRSLRGKLMAYLTAAWREAGEGPKDFEVPLTRQELADYLGVDRSALCRELSRMAADGLVAVSGRRFRMGPPGPS